MSCIMCAEVDDCGCVKRWMLDYGKNELLKKLTEQNVECKNFQNRPITGSILRDKLLQLTNLSKEKRMTLKQSLKKRP